MNLKAPNGKMIELALWLRTFKSREATRLIGAFYRMDTSIIKARLHRTYALTAMRIFHAKTRFRLWRSRHGMKLIAIPVLGGVAVSILVIPFLQSWVGDFFNRAENLGALRSLLGGMGSALIGAAAIAFSIIVFAMQTNVERMPHGLFKQFSSDRRLLCSFVGSFLTAIAISGTSLIPDASWAIPAMLTAIWGVVMIVLFFLYAYRRALQLINPREQLGIMSDTVSRDLRKWSRLADHATILMKKGAVPEANVDGEGFRFNKTKAAFYQANPQWVSVTHQAIHYGIAYAKRFASQGDYEVTDSAFHHLMLINAAYCAAKNGTFVDGNGFFAVAGESDHTINTALEQLRQTMQDALSRGDERLAESTIRAFGGLYGVYLGIDYSGRERRKHHALLASTYLASAVESVAAHDLPDLMMQGIRIMGKASVVALEHMPSSDIGTLVEKIGTFSLVGVVKASHQPVTLTGVEQLATITLDLLVKGEREVSALVGKLRSAVTTVSTSYLGTVDAGLASIHSTTLGPYFSGTSVASLRGQLTALVNELLAAPQEHDQAARIIGNIEAWAHQIFITHKELLLVAVQRRSQFTFDAIGWAIDISALLSALSQAPACPEHLRDRLIRHADWLLATLSWIPDDRDTVTFVENFALTECLFESAWDSFERGSDELYIQSRKLLLGWGKKGGRHETGWDILNSGVKGLTALALAEDDEVSLINLKADLRVMLASDGAPSQEIRQRAADRLTERAHNPFGDRGFRSIDRVLGQQAPNRVREALLEMAQILVGEPQPGAM
ncbi:hypothetical protein [Pseudomonas helleri]|uniref:hypothetical protein n=1 Tax=Pseudomonas helleri TaxID=1608996 RepID=UPI00333EFFC0